RPPCSALFPYTTLFRSLALLDRGQTDDCKLSDLYMKCAIAAYNAEKTSTSAHSIAQSYFKRGDATNAEKFYEEAISLEENSLKRSEEHTSELQSRENLV